MTRGATVRLWLRPGLVGLHLFAVLAVAVCLGMGLWQLGVYDSRQDHERADKQVVPRVALTTVWGADKPFEGRLNRRPVTIEGRFAPAEQQVWVGGKRQDGAVGAWLVAPLLVDDGHAILVVRGWSPSVTTLPAVPSGPVRLSGVLQQGESGGASFDPETREIGSLRIPALTNELPYDLYSGFAIATTPTTSGALPLAELPPLGVPWTVGLRNLAYALQWWVFGLFAAYMWWRMVTESVADTRALGHPAPGERGASGPRVA